MRRGRGNVGVHFLPVRTPNKKTTKGDVELEKAEARTHIAKVLSTRRATTWHGAKYGDIPGDAYTDGRRQAEDFETKALAVMYKPVEGEDCGRLDPFIHLATDLSRHDRNLIHSYLVGAATQFGTSSQPSFCPRRECTVPQLAANDVFVRWIAFVEEMKMIKSGRVDSVSGKIAIATKRASNYNRMREMMANSDNWDRTSTVFALVVTALSEFRAPDTAATRKHLTVAIELLKRKNGLRTIQAMSFAEGMIVLYALASLPLPLFEKRSDVRSALNRWIGAAAMMRKAKRQLVIPKDLLADIESRPSTQWGPQMACLHVLNCVLLRCSRADAADYVRTVDKMARESRGPGNLSPGAIFFMLCSCAEQMGWWTDKPEGPLRTWETIELVTLTSLGSKTGVMAFLASRLVEGPILDIDIEGAKAEIMHNWEARNRQI